MYIICIYIVYLCVDVCKFVYLHVAWCACACACECMYVLAGLRV